VKRHYRLYLEASFWKRLGDPEYHERRKLSYRFLRRCRKDHDALVSRLVLREIEATPNLEERRHVLRRVWAARPKVITTSRRVERIALEIMEISGRGDDAFADMLHIGYSMVADADALVTWDEGDLARDHTRRLVQAYGRREGMGVPLIGTPEEVAGWLDIRIR
jgi:predicted nucleic acid-binding protein